MTIAFLPSRRAVLRAMSGAGLLLLAAGLAHAAAPPTPTGPAAAVDALLKGSFPTDRPGAAVIVTKDAELSSRSRGVARRRRLVVKARKRGIGRNPRTGEVVRIAPGRTVRFKPGELLRDLPPAG